MDYAVAIYRFAAQLPEANCASACILACPWILANLVDEGNQIARMTHSLMNRLGLPPDLRHA